MTCDHLPISAAIDFKQRLQMAAALRSPLAQAKIIAVPLAVRGVPVHVTTAVKEGEVLYGHDMALDGSLGQRVAFVAPLTFWRLQHPGREPLLSRHCRGLRELERDRRRYPRPVEAM